MRSEFYNKGKFLFDIDNCEVYVQEVYAGINKSGIQNIEYVGILTVGTEDYWNMILKMNEQEVKSLIFKLKDMQEKMHYYNNKEKNHD
jgi:hypothetical protein